MPDISTIKLKIRRGTDTQRKSVTLEQGELGYTIDTRRVFIGDGVSLGGISVGNNTLPPSLGLTSQATALIGDTIYSNNVLYQLTGTNYAVLSNWANINAKPDNDYITYDANNRLTVTSSLISTATGTQVDPDGAIINNVGYGIAINADNASIDIDTSGSSSVLRVKAAGINQYMINTSVINTDLGLSGGNGIPLSVKIDYPLVFTSGTGRITIGEGSLSSNYFADGVIQSLIDGVSSYIPPIENLSISAFDDGSGSWGFKNKVINGNFDLWQRYDSTSYTSLSIATALWPAFIGGGDVEGRLFKKMAADRWSTYIRLPSTGYTGDYTIERKVVDGITLPFLNADYYLRLTSNIGGTGNLATTLTDGSGVLAMCNIQNAARILGRTVTLSFWARSQNPTYILSESQIQSTPLGLWTPTISNKVFALSSGWQFFTHTYIMPTSAQVAAAAFNPGTVTVAGTPPVYQAVAVPPLSSWVYQVDLKTFWTKGDKIRHGNPGDAYATSRPGYPTYPGSAMTDADFNTLVSGFTANKTGWYDIAQIQLEEGDVASPFEFKSIGTELALCQRYYEKGYDTDTPPGTTFLATDIQNHVYTTYIPAGLGINGLSAMYISHRVPFKVTKAVTPSIISYSPQTGTQGRADLLRVDTYLSSYNVTVADINTSQFHTNTTSTTGFFEGSMQWTAEAEV